MAEETLSMEELFEKANNGDAEAEYLIADAYVDGNSVEKDEKKATEWYLKSAEHGFVHAQAMIGTAYQYGIGGLEKNITAAISWYEKASEQNHMISTFRLAELYSEQDLDYNGMKVVLPLYEKVAESDEYIAVRACFKAMILHQGFAEIYIQMGALDDAYEEFEKGLHYIEIAESFDCSENKYKELQSYQEDMIEKKSYFLFELAWFNYVTKGNNEKASYYLEKDKCDDSFIVLLRNMIAVENKSESNNDCKEKIIKFLCSLVDSIDDMHKCALITIAIDLVKDYMIKNNRTLECYKLILKMSNIVKSEKVIDLITEKLSHFNYKDGIFGERCKYID